MRRIDCEACPQRQPGGVCDWPPEALDDFRVVGTSAIYKPRQVIFNEGGPCTGLYILCHGAVKIYHSDRFGRDHILELAGSGAVLGEVPFDDAQPLSVSAEAVAESQICFLPRERFNVFLQRYPVTAVRLIAALSSELAAARRKVRDLALKGAESRLADLLIQLAQADGELVSGVRFRIQYTRRELGEMIGVSTETAIRLLARLRQKAVIRVRHKEITISDVQKLIRIASQGEISG